MTSLRSTNPPSARGSVWRSGAGLLTRGSLLRGLPSLAASGVSAESVSPHSGGTVPDLHRVPSPGSVCGPEPIIVPVPTPLRLWLPVVALGGDDLRALLGARSRHGPGHLGPRPAEARARGGVRRPRRAARCARSRPNCPRSRSGVVYAVTDELHQHFVPGRRGAPLDVPIDAVGVAVGVLRLAPARPARIRRALAIDLDACSATRGRSGATGSPTRPRVPRTSIGAAGRPRRGRGRARRARRRQLAAAARALRRGPRARLPAAGGRGERGLRGARGGRRARRRLHRRPRSSSPRVALAQLGRRASAVDGARAAPPPAGADVVVRTREELAPRLRRSA